ncbi:MAG: ABC transporter permease [Oscillospiraceae bacterium]
MDVLLILGKNLLEEGFIYGIMAIGVYITYKILDFPDLSVDGTFPLGACVTAALLTAGMNPWLVCVIAFLCGAVAGCGTGLLHVKLHIPDLLCGIIMMTGLWTVNQFILGGFQGGSVLQFYAAPTIFTAAPMSFLPAALEKYRVLILGFVLVVAVKLLMDAFLKTKSGLLLRGAGDNSQYVTQLAQNQGKLKILGLAIGNGCTALAGCVLAQQNGSASVDMGIGMVVMALAAVIIGTSVFGRIRRLKPTTMVLLGMLIYKGILVIAMFWLPTTFLKLTMALLFVVALLTDKMGRKKGVVAHG